MFEEIIGFIRQWCGTDDFIPLHAPIFGAKDREYVLDAIDSTFVSSVGEYVNRFERELAAYTGAKRAVATVNGTTALQVALDLIGVRFGDEVITQPLTFVATANAISHSNAQPVFVDVDRETLGLSPDALRDFLETHAQKREDGAYNQTTHRRISAIVPMHTFGHPCRMEAILQIADSWRIPVIEDAAEALGSFRNNRHCGTFGKMGVLSFNGNKIITCGGGGAIITNDDELANQAKHLTTTAKLEHPWEFEHDQIGYNFRMPNLNAALACAQMEKLPRILSDKRALARAYREFFSGLDWLQFIEEPVNSQSNYWLCSVAVKDPGHRDAFLQVTNRAGVMTRPAWRLMSDLDIYGLCQTGPLDNAQWLQQRIVSLPSSARLFLNNKS